MAVLTKKEILEKIKNGELAFTPEIDSFQLQTHSVDLRLGYTFLVHKAWKITKNGREALGIDMFLNQQRDFDVIELEEGQFFDLLPGEHVTVSSLELVKMPEDVMGVLYPRSSVNRRGVSVDLTGIIDAGYEGQLIIPIKNNTSQVVRIYPGERFCQVVFESLETKPEKIRKSRHHLKDVVDTPEPEDSEELELIKSGKVRELKDKFRI